MKKFYSLFLTLSLCVAGASAAAPIWKSNISLGKKNAVATAIQAKRAAARTAETTKWLPGQAIIFETSDKGATWDEYETRYYTYENGLLVKEEASNYITTTVYNENGYWIEQVSQTKGFANKWVNNEKNVRGYDEIVPSYTTLKQIYTWNTDTEAWVMSYMHEYIVARNDDNDVDAIYVRTYLVKDGEPTDPRDTHGFRVLYDQSGKAHTIITFAYNNEYQAMTADITYQDIVWAECGQIMNVDYLCLNDVRAKSYDITYQGEVLAKTNITYGTDELFSCTKVTEDATDEYIETYTFKYLDNYGSYEEAIEFNEAGVISGEKLIERYNEYGEQIEVTYYMIEEGVETIMDQMIAEPTYEDSKLVEIVISSTNYDTGELEPFEKYVYSNHVAVAGIENVVVDQNAPVEFYNLQGVRVDNPSNGIFIRRQGSSVTKVAL